jgi:signal transduction histidine kinase
MGLHQRLLKQHRRLPTRWRMTAWILLIVFVITAIAGVVAVKLVERRLLDTIDEENRTLSDELVRAFEVIPADTLLEFADEQGFGDSSQAFIILDADGIEFALPSGTGGDPDPLPDLTAVPFSQLRRDAGEPFEIDGHGDVPDYRLLAGQLVDGRMLVVATPLDGLKEGVETVVRVLLAVAIVASVILVVVVAWVAGHVTRPLVGMIETAEGIGTGALGTRIPVEGVDDVARLAGALNAMLDRLQVAFDERAASEAKLRRFVADASHELRTPLAAVLGYAELVQTGMAATSADVDHALGRIVAEGDRMRLLVEELLLLARLDHGRPAHLTTVDAADVASVAVADALAISSARPITMHRTDADLRVEVDPASLRQAIDNLLANTRAHTPEGTHVHVTVARGDDDVTVTVDDDGPGIDPAEVDRVFDRFFRADESRARPGGSGLGLSIVAAVAEAHGGTVTAGRAPRGGARITMTLPAAQPVGPVPAAVAQPEV